MTGYSRKTLTRRGFTIIELLVVIAIMAVVATLATGAAIKSIKQSRSKRISAMIRSLELGLVNYRALHGEWSYTFDNPDASNKNMQTVKGTKNAEVFKKIYDDVKAGRALLDASALLTKVNGRRMTVKEALESGSTANIPVGYANPDNADDFKYFQIQYNFLTDSVKVLKQD